MIRIAIDGPSGAGKSTVAKAVAKELNIIYVDTGALYRTVGYYAYIKGVDPKSSDDVIALLPEIKIELKYEGGVQKVYLNGEDLGDKIRQPEISMYASAVSAIQKVRDFLLELQKDIASKNSVIMDGRDIGTVIMPNADVKFFMFASDEKRAERRTKELKEKGIDAKYEDVLAEMRERDNNDRTRAVAPALPAEDAIMFDNSDLTFEENVKKIIEIIKKKTKRKRLNPFYSFMYFLGSNLFKFLYRVKIVNPENEPLDKNFIVASNHTAALDPIIVGATLKNQIRYMGKKELFLIPIVGSFIKSLGAYPIDRKGNDVGAIKRTIKFLNDGDCIGIFPQGTRRPYVDPKTTEVKNGVSLIAHRSGADILPLAIKTKRGKLGVFRKTYIIIGKLIKNEDLGFENGNEVSYREVTDKIFGEICKLYDETKI